MGYPSLTITTVAHRLSSSDGCFLVGGHKRPRSRPTPGTYAPPPKAPKQKRHTHTGGWRPPIRSEEAQARRDHQRTLRRRKYFRDNRKRWQDQLDKDVYGKKASWAGRRSEGASGSLAAPKRRDQITAGRRLHQEAALPLVEGALVRGMNGKTVRASAQTSKEYIGCVGWEEVDETICNLVAGCTRPWGHAGLCALPANATRPARRSAQNRGHVPSASASARRSSVCASGGCRICFEAVAGHEGEEGERPDDARTAAAEAGGVTRCGHLYHTTCLQRWLQQQRAEEKETVCAVCRAPLLLSTRRMFGA